MRRRTLRPLLIGALVMLTIVPLAVWAQGDVHTVEPGDTLTSIALRYDTSVEELKERNELTGDLLQIGQRLALPGADGWRLERAPIDADWASLARAWDLPADLIRDANPNVIRPAGQMLRLPPDVGVLVAPAAGEDLIAFAARLGVPPGAIASRNGLMPPYRIEAGLPLLLPVGALAGTPSGSPTLPDTNDVVRSARSHDELRTHAFELLGLALTGVRLEPPDDGFTWPLSASSRITSRFGWRAISVAGNRYHLGIDLASSPGTPVRAVRDGVVARTGWIGAYGYAVYLRHADGFETRYAHLSGIDAVEGATVRRGDQIGRVGSTGASTGPHLHFEVRLDGRALDPLGVLPSGPARGSTSN